MAVTCGDALVGSSLSAVATVSPAQSATTQSVTRETAGSIALTLAAGADRGASFANTGSSSSAPVVAAYTEDNEGTIYSADSSAAVHLDFVLCQGSSAGDTVLGGNHDLTFQFALAGYLYVPDWVPVPNTIQNLFRNAGALGRYRNAVRTASSPLLTVHATTDGDDPDRIDSNTIMAPVVPEYTGPPLTYNPQELAFETVWNRRHVNLNGGLVHDFSMHAFADASLDDMLGGPSVGFAAQTLVGVCGAASLPAGAGVLFNTGLFLPFCNATGLLQDSVMPLDQRTGPMFATGFSQITFDENVAVPPTSPVPTPALGSLVVLAMIVGRRAARSTPNCLTHPDWRRSTHCSG